MNGAIFGDIVGSTYEFNSTKKTDFELLPAGSRPTDDSIMTLAVADALMNSWGKDDETVKAALVSSMQEMGRRYPHAGYGGNFSKWINSEDAQPYNSYGNGSAMRVSSVGWPYADLEKTLHAAKLTAEVSHNHPEGIKGAQAVAAAIYMARKGESKDAIIAYITNTFGYDMTRSVADIRAGYHFDVSCQGSVPEAIRCFYEAESYIEAVRLAVSLGGDSDTQACIAGSIAEAFYGMDKAANNYLDQYLDEHCKTILRRFHTFVEGVNEPAKKEAKTAKINAEEMFKQNSAIKAAINQLHDPNTNREEGVSKLFYMLYLAGKAGAHFVVPVKKLSEIEDTDGRLSVEGENAEGRMVMLHVTDSTGKELMPVFTSEVELKKGEAADFIYMPILKYMEKVMSLEGIDGAVIDPYSNSCTLTKVLIQRLLDVINDIDASLEK